MIAMLKEKFERAKAMVITGYKGMTVVEMGELRDKLRTEAVEYRVVKNTLARIAVKDTPSEEAAGHFDGPVGVALGYDDPVTVARAVVEFAKGNNKLEIGGGIIEGAYCDSAAIAIISKLPARPVMLGMLAGTMQAPASQMVRLLGATVTGLGYGLNALREKRATE